MTQASWVETLSEERTPLDRTAVGKGVEQRRRLCVSFLISQNRFAEVRMLDVVAAEDMATAMAATNDAAKVTR